jgi:integrase
VSTTPSRGPIVIDTDVFGAHLVPGSPLLARYEPIIVGRPAFIHVLPAFENRSVASIQQVDVRRFIADMTDAGAGPGHRGRGARGAAARAQHRGRLWGDPRQSVRRRSSGALPEGGDALPHRRRGRAAGVDDHAAVRDAGALPAYTGLRAGEIGALRVGRDLTPDSLVFSAPQGGPLRHKNFYRRFFKPAVAAAELPAGLRFHDLRHTCAALLIALGAHPKAIQERLGHATINITLDRYGHPFPALDEALTDRLEDMRTKARAEVEGAAITVGAVVPITTR